MNKEKLKQMILQKRLEKYWETAFKETSLEAEEKGLDFICEHINFKENLLNDLYVEAYQMQHELNKIDILDIEVDEGIDLMNNFMNKFEKIEDEYYKKIAEVKDNFLTIGLKIRELSDRVLKISAFHVTNEKDRMLLTKEFLGFKQKMVNMATSFGYHDLLEGDDIFRYIRDDLKTMNKILVKREIKDSEEANRELEKMKKERQKYSKLFDYKDMCKFAIEQGYRQCRQGATDHIIFKYPDSGKIVPIPTHDLGIGLAQKIKKQIKNNKAA